jgi:nicotinate-nucleotide adenylyltransferase
VLIVPAHDPPHRPDEPHASSFHRFALVALAISGRTGYRASDVELRREGPSYTALTLRDLHAEGWQPSQLFFILGADAFAEISTWHDYPAILEASNFVVIARPGASLDEALARTPGLGARACRPGEAVTSFVKTRIFLVEATTSPVSSTDIRKRLQSGADIDGLVPAAVARYIRTHHLYGAVDGLHGEED